MIRFYVNYFTFGIDIAAGIIIGISAGIALVAFLKILNKPMEKKLSGYVWREDISSTRF